MAVGAKEQLGTLPARIAVARAYLAQTQGDFAAADVYLRTATGVDAEGWASYGQVRMPDYRWGIFLADAKPGRTIGFGDHFGETAWQRCDMVARLVGASIGLRRRIARRLDPRSIRAAAT